MIRLTASSAAVPGNIVAVQGRRGAAERVRPINLLLVAAIFAACADHTLPTEPPATSGIHEPEQEIEPGVASLLKERARILDPDRVHLVSTPAQLQAGQYRFRVEDDLAEPITRDDVIVVRVDGELRPRTVLSAARSAEELVLETGPAFWSDVINTGRFGMRAPIGQGATIALTTGDLPDIDASETVGIDPIGGRFDIDLCDLADSLLFEPICGSAMSKTVKWVTISGTLDSLAIHDFDIQVSGALQLDFSVDGGGVFGGTPPVFAPCNRGAYPGCLSTPTGAALIEFLRTYAPTIPEASLPPVRVCIPGTRVRTRRGYWVYPGFPNPPYWVRPVYETCRVSSAGELPEIVMPSVRSARAVIQPHVQGGATLYAQGDVKARLQVPIPRLGVKKTVDKSGVHAEVELGIFVALDLTLKNSAVAPRVTFDEEIRITQVWSPESGWVSSVESIFSEQSATLEQLENPDSLVVKLSMPVAINAKLQLLGLTIPAGGGTPTDTTDLLGLHAGATYAPFAETVWTRHQIHPDDPELDNWQLSTDVAYEIPVGAGIDFPGLIPIPPDIKTSWDTVMEFGRASLTDRWGRGNLRVETTTTGTDLDPDGYQVLVRRYDPTQLQLDGNAERIPEYDPEAMLDMAIGIDDAVVFGKGALPCTVIYSEGALRVASFALPPPPPPPPSPREPLVSIPKYALVHNCDELLIARHIVTLAGVAQNCTVTAGPSRTEVWLQQRRQQFEGVRSDTTLVEFEVICGTAGPTGALAVTPSIPASDIGGVQLFVDGQSYGTIQSGETRTLAGLAAGERTVALGPIDFCAMTPVTITVIANDTVDVPLNAVCAVPDPVPGTLTVRVNATGDGAAPNDLVLKLDGEARAVVSSVEATPIEGLPALDPVVLLLSNTGGRCRVTSANPLVVALDAQRNPETTVMDLECTSAAIDTLLGAVSGTPLPVPTAHLQTVDGSAVQLTGPALSDFLAIAGTTVRVWGVQSGTSFDVYGYEVLSSLLEPRYLGIVSMREGTLWLMGDAPLELVDAPAELANLLGAFVWVGGTEAGVGALRPTVFGVIREAQP